MKQLWAPEEIKDATKDNVKANPQLEGTETTLTSIDINGTKYSIGGGGKLYHHHIVLTETGLKYLTINITTSSSTAYTYSTLYAYIRTITDNTEYVEKGYHCISRDGTYRGYSCCGISNSIYSSNYDGTNAFLIDASATVTDTITEV